MPQEWMPGAERAETAARGGYGVADGKMKPTATVWHCMQGYLGTMLLWAKERPAHHQVSYHFGLSLAGEIVQFVPISTPAWHAGRLDNAPPTWGGYRPGVNPGGHTIGVAAEGFWDSPGIWNAKQVDAAIRVQRWISEQTGIAPSHDTVIGHYEIAPLSRANDPGPRWPRQKIIEESGARMTPTPLPEPRKMSWMETVRRVYYARRGEKDHGISLRDDGRREVLTISWPKRSRV